MALLLGIEPKTNSLEENYAIHYIIRALLVVGVGIEPTLHHLSGDCFTEV